MVRRERIVTNDATAGEVDATALDAEIAAERASGGSDHAAAVSRGIMRAAVIITLGNVFSRLLGFARDLLTAVLFGASVQTDGYFTALRVQTSIYDLLVSGVISAAFIPVFSAIRDDDARFRRVGSTILTITLLVMAVAMGALELFARDAIQLLDPQKKPDVLRTGVDALRLLGPAVIFLGLSGVLTAMLYAKQRFVFPAFSPAVFNLSIVVAAIGLSHFLGITSLVVGVVGGAAAQVVLQAYGLRRVRLWPTLALRDPHVRQILLLSAPVFLGLIITQGQVLIDLRFANGTGDAGLSYLTYATRLIQLPLGIVATAMSLASLPMLSRLEGADYRATLARGLKITLILILPAVVVCGVLAQPVIALAFQHSAKFTAFQTTRTADALRYYTPGLAFAAVDQLLIFAFYAKNDTKTPVIVGVISIVCYLVVALATLHPLSFRGLALADSAKQFSHAAVLYVLLRRWQGRIEGLELGGALGRILLAGVAMGLLCYGLLRLADAVHWTTGALHLLVFLPLTIGAGAALYGLLLYRLGVPELSLLVQRLGGRFRRG